MGDLLPSFSTIYKQTFSLFSKSYIEMLPFLLLAIILQYGIEILWPTTSNAFDTIMLTKLFLTLALSAIFYSLLICGMARRHHGELFHYGPTISQGLKRTLPVFISYLIMVAPLLLVYGYYIVTAKTWPLRSVDVPHSFFVAFCVAGAIVLIMGVYFALSWVAIVEKHQGAWQGLKHSAQIIKWHWWRTCLLFLFPLLLVMILSIAVEVFFPNELIQICISTLLLMPFYSALMLIYYDGLEKNYLLNLVRKSAVEKG
jgi:hypothetical protein